MPFRLRRRTFLVAGPSLLLGASPTLAEQIQVGGRSPRPMTGADVQSLWTGAVTADSIAVAARLKDISTVKTLRLAVSTDADFHSITAYSEPVASDPVYGVAKLSCSVLTENTSYHYAVECDGVLDRITVGTFRTPRSGAHSFSFAAGSCSATGSASPIFGNLRAKAGSGGIEFFQHMGDLHYGDIASDHEGLFHAALDAVFASERQHACWRSMPMYYIWDDHDYGPNNSGRDSPSRRASLATFRSRVPSVRLASSDAENGVYHSYVRGRVRFVVSDLRSEAVENGRYGTHDPRQVMMSATQFDWFKDELLRARDAGQVAIWISTRPWIGSPSDAADGWRGFHAFRDEVVDFIVENNLSRRMAVLSGDMHALAYDDGTYAPGGLKVMHAAPLDGGASHKSGPYTAGPFPIATGPVASQYGLVDVTDTGGEEIGIRFRGVAVDRATGDETVPIDRSFSLTVTG